MLVQIQHVKDVLKRPPFQSQITTTRVDTNSCRKKSLNMFVHNEKIHNHRANSFINELIINHACK